MILKKIICSALILISVTFFSTTVVAQADISSEVNVVYNVKADGITEVEYQITLKNIFTDRYAKSYTLQLEGTSPENIRVVENDKLLEFATESFDKTKRVTIEFPEAVVGKGKARTFYVNYSDSSFTTKNGEVWDISIPRLGSSESFRSYNVKLNIPSEFGDPAYISPTPIETEGYSFKFNKNLIASTGIHAAFGKFQVYSLTLKYSLENPLHQSTSIDIALPPDTSYQRIYINEINPRPDALESDEDGNWIATYSLNSREQKEVELKASAQVFNSPIQSVEISDEILSSNLKSTSYWDTNNEDIKALANRYKTPEEIYNFVVRTLQYDTSRIVPNADRLGAVKALKQPNSALCNEFTDLFIAVARAAGIPAREVNGYAFSDNPSFQPLSLVTDVLHAWPEYWDANKKVWIAVDPTWENTTGGIDYFTTMDLKHIAFAIHGQDDTLPYPAGSYKLGAFPEKSVVVTIGDLPPNRESLPEISVNKIGGFPLFTQRYEIEVYNPGPSALYNVPVTVNMENTKIEDNANALLPFGSYKLRANTRVGLLASQMPDKIEVSAGGSEYSIKTQKSDIALYHSATILLIILASVGGLFLYINGHHFSKKRKSQ